MTGLISPLQVGNLDPLIIVPVLIVGAVLVALYVLWTGRALFAKPIVGKESLLRKHGIASTDITVEEGGEVIIDGIVWKARHAPEAVGRPISKGETVVVVGVSSLTVMVERWNDKFDGVNR